MKSYFRYLLLLLLIDGIEMSWHLLPKSDFQYDWANSCDHWRMVLLLAGMAYAVYKRWKPCHHAYLLFIVWGLFETLDGFDELHNSNITAPYIEFALYAVSVAVITIHRIYSLSKK